jgi:hypothetical protein
MLRHLGVVVFGVEEFEDILGGVFHEKGGCKVLN